MISADIAFSTRVRAQVYRAVSGRDAFLEKVWGADFVAKEQAAARKFAEKLAAEREKTAQRKR